MDYNAINFQRKLARFSERWSPKVIARMNDYQFKLVTINTGAAGAALTAEDNVRI